MNPRKAVLRMLCALVAFLLSGFTPAFGVSVVVLNDAYEEMGVKLVRSGSSLSENERVIKPSHGQLRFDADVLSDDRRMLATAMTNGSVAIFSVSGSDKYYLKVRVGSNSYGSCYGCTYYRGESFFVSSSVDGVQVTITSAGTDLFGVSSGGGFTPISASEY